MLFLGERRCRAVVAFPCDLPAKQRTCLFVMNSDVQNGARSNSVVFIVMCYVNMTSDMALTLAIPLC